MTMMHAEFRVERLSGVGLDRNRQTDGRTDRRTDRQKNGNEKLLSTSALEDPVPAVNCRVGIRTQNHEILERPLIDSDTKP